MPLGMVKYTYGAQRDKEWFIGTSRDDIAVGTFVLEGGYRQQLQDGSIWSASYLPTVIGEPIWKTLTLAQTSSKKPKQRAKLSPTDREYCGLIIYP
ncbi:hypothetical protein JCM19239_6663 [Vibrio variabilis]|uniref:Uncharacterized protein n=1 Tax=Vibrio variabilis TaxID=990271 RepID=A0ABQ0JGC6_9VIBR|nr:hypothetical protein JCM19239_6663 [Vibrio variabilis]